MLEHTTDRLFWTLTSIIVGALIMTIGVNVFPKATQGVIQPISGVIKQADRVSQTSTNSTNQAISDATNFEVDHHLTPEQQVEYDKTHAVEADTLGFKIADNGDGTARIVDYDTSHGLDVTVPAYVKNNGQLLKVTAIGSDYSNDHPYNEPDTFRNWYGFANLHINSIKLPETIEYIGWRGLYGNNFTHLEMPNSVQTTGDGAFAENHQLKTITIPQHAWLGRWLVDDGVTITRN